MNSFRAMALAIFEVAVIAPPFPAQIKAFDDAHHGDFDYVLGDCLDQGRILDEYRVAGDNGETYYVTTSLRTYAAALERLEPTR
jgi:hypothetical protein